MNHNSPQSIFPSALKKRRSIQPAAPHESVCLRANGQVVSSSKKCPLKFKVKYVAPSNLLNKTFHFMNLPHFFGLLVPSWYTDKRDCGKRPPPRPALRTFSSFRPPPHFQDSERCLSRISFKCVVRVSWFALGSERQTGTVGDRLIEPRIRIF